MTREQYLALIGIERSKKSSVSSEQAYAQYRQMNGLTPEAPLFGHSSNGPAEQAPSTKDITSPATAQAEESTK
jgi:hypothetical protein